MMGMNMEQYIAEFTAKGVDGQHLLCMDSSKLKVGLCIIIYLFFGCSIGLNNSTLKNVLPSRSLAFLAKEIVPPLRGD